MLYIQVKVSSFELTKRLAHFQKVEHAGYTRHILQYNPLRYDSEGDELDEEDSDATADAEAAEENPYSGISLESESHFCCHLLCQIVLQVEKLTWIFSIILSSSCAVETPFGTSGPPFSIKPL